MQEEDAFFDAVALGGAFEGVDQLREGLVEAEDGVAAVVVGIGEEAIVDPLFAGDFVRVDAVREDHVVDPLEGVAGDAGILSDDIEVLVEGAFPVFLAELVEILALSDEGDDFAAAGHSMALHTAGVGAGSKLWICDVGLKRHCGLRRRRLEPPSAAGRGELSAIGSAQHEANAEPSRATQRGSWRRAPDRGCKRALISGVGGADLSGGDLLLVRDKRWARPFVRGRLSYCHYS